MCSTWWRSCLPSGKTSFRCDELWFCIPAFSPSLSLCPASLSHPSSSFPSVFSLNPSPFDHHHSLLLTCTLLALCLSPPSLPPYLPPFTRITQHWQRGWTWFRKMTKSLTSSLLETTMMAKIYSTSSKKTMTIWQTKRSTRKLRLVSPRR